MIEIKVDVNNIESIREGLRYYAELIKSREGINSERYGGNLGITFVDMDGNGLKVEEIESERVLKAYEGYWSYSYGGTSNEDIFFAKALEHEELKEDILIAFLEVIDYAREKNDTSDLWAGDDNTLIGIGSIFAFATLYPEYTYLLGLYLIPYWDDEHAPYALHCVEGLVSKLGVCRDTLKLFCYTDNGYLRNSLFDNLTDWFRENKEEYDWFKETLKERFKEYDYLQYSDRDIIRNPIDSFYMCLISDRPDWNSCEEPEANEFSDFFIYDNSDIEAEKLKVEIEEYIGKSLVEPIKKRVVKKKETIHPFLAWQTFIESEFKNGKFIFAYIYNGGDRSCLEYLNGLYPDLLELIRASDYEIREFIPSYIYSTEELFERLDRITDKLYTWLSNTYHGVYKEMILRFTDFFFELSGKAPFSEDYIEELVDEYEAISREEFNIRYPQPFEKQLAFEVEEYIGSRRRKVDSLVELIYKNRKNRLKEVEGVINPIISGRENKGRSKLLLLLTKLLTKDSIIDSQDEFNIYAYRVISDNIQDIFVKDLEGNTKYQADMDSWKEINLDIINNGLRDLEVLKDYFDYDESKEFKGYDFNFYSSWGASVDLIQSIYLILKNRVYMTDSYRNILNFYLECNPVKTIHSISKLYRSRYRDEFDNYDKFLVSLKDIGIDQDKIDAWRAFYSYDMDREEEENQLIDRLAEDNRVEKVLEYLYEEERFYYYKKIRLKYPSIDLITKKIFDVIDRFNRINIISVPTRIYNDLAVNEPIYNGLLKDYKGDMLDRDEVKGFQINNLPDDYPRLITDDNVVMLYLTEDGIKVLGRTYLVFTYLNRREDLEADAKLVIVDGSKNDYLSVESISQNLLSYFKGEIEFEGVESYIKDIRSEYFFRSSGEYSIIHAYIDAEREVKKRFLNIYARIDGDIYYTLFPTIDDSDREYFVEIIEILEELGLDIGKLLDYLIEEEEYAYDFFDLFIGKLDIVERIKTYNEKNRIEAVEMLTREAKFRKYLREFKDDKSRLIREIVGKYCR